MTRRIIIDTDPGQDDAVAILMALARPEPLAVEAIAAVAGNVPLDRTSRNALKIVDDGIILRSEANLVASVRAPWSAAARAAARTILTRIAAEEGGRTTREVQVFLDEIHKVA